VKDHVLVKQLECDVFITADRGFEHEHDLKSLSFPQLLKAVATIRAGDLVHVHGLPVD
jgi:hypothetical protein